MPKIRDTGRSSSPEDDEAGKTENEKEPPLKLTRTARARRDQVPKPANAQSGESDTLAGSQAQQGGSILIQDTSDDNVSVATAKEHGMVNVKDDKDLEKGVGGADHVITMAHDGPSGMSNPNQKVVLTEGIVQMEHLSDIVGHENVDRDNLAKKKSVKYKVISETEGHIQQKMHQVNNALEMLTDVMLMREQEHSQYQKQNVEDNYTQQIDNTEKTTVDHVISQSNEENVVIEVVDDLYDEMQVVTQIPEDHVMETVHEEIVNEVPVVTVEDPDNAGDQYIIVAEDIGRLMPYSINKGEGKGHEYQYYVPAAESKNDEPGSGDVVVQIEGDDSAVAAINLTKLQLPKKKKVPTATLR